MVRRDFAAAVLFLLSNDSKHPFSHALVQGVPPEVINKYQEGSPFHCLNSEKQVPFTAVNDNYCDCADGSDEPGTGACSGQQDTLFHCPNEGGIPQLVYASRVGDGICDCCDGSDEAELAARRPKAATKCPNTCAEEGLKQQQERQKRLEELRGGIATQEAIIAKAREERNQKREDVSRLQASLPELEAKVAEIRKRKEEADAAKSQEECKTELPRLRELVKTLEARVKELEAEKEKLKGDEKAEGINKEKKVISEYTKWMENAEDAVAADEEAEEAGSNLAASLKASTASSSVSSPTEEEDPLAKELKDAEDALRSAKDSVSNLEKTLGALSEDQLGYADLIGKCLEKRVTEYTYKLCFFDDAKQDYTSLGRWEGFNGPKEGNFANGQMCYGGPARSLKVLFECGSEQEITDFYEPSRCSYQATVKHPGACRAEDAAGLEKPPTRHPKDDEL